MLKARRFYDQANNLKLIEFKTIKKDKQAPENWEATTTYMTSDLNAILEVETFGVNKPENSDFKYNKYELANVQIFDNFFFLVKEHLSIQDGTPKSTYDLLAYDYTGKNLSEKTNLEYQSLNKERKLTTIKLNKKFRTLADKTKE